MNRIDPPPPRKAGATALIFLVIAMIIAMLFIGRDVWHGKELQNNQEAGNYQGQQTTEGLR